MASRAMAVRDRAYATNVAEERLVDWVAGRLNGAAGDGGGDDMDVADDASERGDLAGRDMDGVGDDILARAMGAVGFVASPGSGQVLRQELVRVRVESGNRAGSAAAAALATAAAPVVGTDFFPPQQPQGQQERHFQDQHQQLQPQDHQHQQPQDRQNQGRGSTTQTRPGGEQAAAGWSWQEGEFPPPPVPVPDAPMAAADEPAGAPPPVLQLQEQVPNLDLQRQEELSDLLDILEADPAFQDNGGANDGANV